jgi:hypothetical protein
LVLEEPFEEELVVFGEFDLGFVLGVEGGDDVEAAVVEPLAGFGEVDPVFVFAELGGDGRGTLTPALSQRERGRRIEGHEEDDFGAELRREFERWGGGLVEGN